MESTLRRTWAEIDLDALAHNYRALRAQMGPEARFLGVVKADAYGHGAIETARTLEELGSFAAEKYWIVRRWIAETAIPRLREFLDHLKYTVFHEEEACKEETEETCEEKAEEEECAAEEELDEELVVEA